MSKVHAYLPEVLKYIYLATASVPVCLCACVPACLRACVPVCLRACEPAPASSRWLISAALNSPLRLPLRACCALRALTYVLPDDERGWTDRSGNSRLLELDIYQSSDPSAPTGDSIPAILVMHGGGFSQGSRRDSTVVTEARRFAQHGFRVYSIGYRTTAQRGLPDVGSVRAAVRDLQMAVGFVANQAGIDRARIAVFGTSAGAIAAASIGLVSP